MYQYSQYWVYRCILTLLYIPECVSTCFFEIYHISIQYRFIKTSVAYVWIKYSYSNMNVYPQERVYRYILAISLLPDYVLMYYLKFITFPFDVDSYKYLFHMF